MEAMTSIHNPFYHLSRTKCAAMLVAMHDLLYNICCLKDHTKRRDKPTAQPEQHIVVDNHASCMARHLCGGRQWPCQHETGDASIE